MYTLKLKKCEFVGNKAIPRGKSIILNIKEAAEKFASSGTHKARTNLLAVRTGWYIGLIQRQNTGKTNFVFSSQNANSNDFSFLFKQNPKLKDEIVEVYLAEDVIIPREHIVS